MKITCKHIMKPPAKIVVLHGTLSRVDEWGRFHIEFASPDRGNTRMQLEAFDCNYAKKHTTPGSPVHRDSFVVKLDSNTLVAVRSAMHLAIAAPYTRVVDQQVSIEAELKSFHVADQHGWYILARIITCQPRTG